MGAVPLFILWLMFTRPALSLTFVIPDRQRDVGRSDAITTPADGMRQSAFAPLSPCTAWVWGIMG